MSLFKRQFKMWVVLGKPGKLVYFNPIELTWTNLNLTVGHMMIWDKNGPYQSILEKSIS